MQSRLFGGVSLDLKKSNLGTFFVEPPDDHNKGCIRLMGARQKSIMREWDT
jgi:hypothetical protein